MIGVASEGFQSPSFGEGFYDFGRMGHLLGNETSMEPVSATMDVNVSGKSSRKAWPDMIAVSRMQGINCQSLVGPINLKHVIPSSLCFLAFNYNPFLSIIPFMLLLSIIRPQIHSSIHP